MTRSYLSPPSYLPHPFAERFFLFFREMDTRGISKVLKVSPGPKLSIGLFASARSPFCRMKVDLAILRTRGNKKIKEREKERESRKRTTNRANSLRKTKTSRKMRLSSIPQRTLLPHLLRCHVRRIFSFHCISVSTLTF